MEYYLIKNINDSHFQEAWDLYQNSFPEEEKRSINQQIKAFCKKSYHFEIALKDNQLIGFILWWDFSILKFIDHFAVSPHLRNKGAGKKILDDFIKNDDKKILLEVEHPHSSIQKRRIDFYHRSNFKLNPHFYQMPPLIPNGAPVDLLLMSYPMTLSTYEFNFFKDKCLPIIFDLK